MADDPNQLGGTLQDRVAAVIHSVAALHAAQEGQGQSGANPTPPQGPGQSAAQPTNPMMAQQSALMGAPPQQPQPQAPAQPAAAAPQPLPQQPSYGAPSAQGQRGALPQGVTMQQGGPTQEFPGGVTKYNGVFPPQGQGQPQQGQAAAIPPLGAPPPPVTSQEALARMNKMGLNTASPGVQAMVPAMQRHFNELSMKDYEQQMNVREKAALIDSHAAAAELARKKAVMTGAPQDISRAKDLATLAQKYIDQHANEKTTGGFIGIGKGGPTPEYAQAQQDIKAGMDKLRGDGGGQAPSGSMSPEDHKASLDNAREALKAGWSREDVIKKLQAAGVDPAGL